MPNLVKYGTKVGQAPQGGGGRGGRPWYGMAAANYPSSPGQACIASMILSDISL